MRSRYSPDSHSLNLNQFCNVKYVIVGHSLGAHGCGVASKFLPTKLGRVSGLDAALALYGSNNTDETLATGDAKMVDVIHTCGGLIGFMAPLGDADFYPNEGVTSQPGCGIDVTGIKTVYFDD